MLSQLLIRGYLAAPAPVGTPDVDLLVTGETGETFARVQVKTRSAAYGRLKAWTMSPRHEQLVDDRMFYALVDFEQQPTAVYVVPSAVVAQVISTASRLYQSTPGPRVAQRKPNRFRQIEQGYGPDMPDFQVGWMEPYRDRFDLLGEPGSDPRAPRGGTEQQIASK